MITYYKNDLDKTARQIVSDIKNDLEDQVFYFTISKQFAKDLQKIMGPSGQISRAIETMLEGITDKSYFVGVQVDDEDYRLGENTLIVNVEQLTTNY